ncbi:hypothetical protein ABVF61_07470 [Roseibium sp. HPY-6]|uniref:lipoyl protein ligase domain-containing protein n=1 Tax=Roseibium sp. HPY-6 TaxID=3229852 RepID=UPI0033904A5C
MTAELRQVRDAAEGLALEAALFSGTGPGVLVWSPQSRGIVYPAALIRKHGLESSTAFEGWPITMRPTGGGPVPQGPGMLNLALAYTVENGATIEETYADLTEILRDALSGLKLDLECKDIPASFCDGSWNLGVNGKKLVGTAQRWKPLPGGGCRVLAHALIFVEGNVQSDAEMIADLHRHLGLPPVDPKKHVTLRALKGAEMPDRAEIAHQLYHASWRRLRTRRPALAAA